MHKRPIPNPKSPVPRLGWKADKYTHSLRASCSLKYIDHVKCPGYTVVVHLHFTVQLTDRMNEIQLTKPGQKSENDNTRNLIAS